MKRSELRLGNYVEYAGVICEVEEIHKKTITTNGVTAPISSFLSIPLTEEWLLKLGFNNEYKKGYIGIDFGNTDFVLSTPDNKENNTGRYAWFFRQGRVPMFKFLEYVHELQNLYFALTGEELTIKQTEST